MATEKQLLKKAQGYNDSKKYDEVVNLLTREILEQHQSADLYAEKAQALWRTNDFETSFRVAEEALKLDADNAKANNYLGNYYSVAKNSHYRAIDYYLIAIKSEPDYVTPLCNLGYAYLRLKKIPDAKEYFDQASDLDKDYIPTFLGLAEWNYQLKNYHRSEELLLEALEKDPNYPDVYNSLGVIMAAQKLFAKAIKNYEKAISLDSKQYRARYNLGNIYRQQKNYKKSIELYEEAISLNPQYDLAYNNLSLSHMGLKEYDKAIKILNKGLLTNPKNPQMHFNLGEAYFANKQFQEALPNYKKMLDLVEQDSDYLVSRARDKIAEIHKSLKNADYSHVSDLVTQIKELLLFKDQCVTHYTGLTVANYLVLEKSPLRLSEGAFLNDTSEGRELFKFLPPLLQTHSNQGTVATPFTQKPFIGSFVAESKHDDLTLWRMYGKEDKEEARGCAITIERKNLLDEIKSMLLPNEDKSTTENNEEELRFYRVAYIDKTTKSKFVVPGARSKDVEVLNECMNDLSAKIKAFNMNRPSDQDKLDVLELLNEIAYLFKSVEYQYEQEIRLIIKGIGFEKIVDTQFTPPKVYIELVPLDKLISKITLGPKVERAEEWAASFHYHLGKVGLYPEILTSRLPFK